MRVEEFLKHHGVKGMKWGVRRYQPYPKGKKHKGRFLGVKNRAKSKKRELSQLKETRVSEMDKKSTATLKSQARRMALENDFKRLSSISSRAGTSADREQYRRRGEMSNEELKRKVDRLQAKDNLKKEAQSANRTAIDNGKKIATQVAAVVIPAAAGYAVSKVSSSHGSTIKSALKKNINPKAMDAIFNTILR